MNSRYLGVILDKNLSWKPQIENVKSKILRIFYVLRRTRPFIDRNTVVPMILYNTMIQPYFDYCNVIWLNPISAQVKKLQTVQNNALRLILNVDNRHHRRNLYEDLKIYCLSVKGEVQ